MAFVFILHHNQNQTNIKRQRVFRDRTQALDVFNDEQLLERYRFPRNIIFSFIDGVDRQLRRPTARSQSLPTSLQVLVTLRYLAKADFYSELADIHGISKASVAKLLPKVCKALCLLLDNVKYPVSVNETRAIKHKFHQIARFPNVVGAIDGTLIAIQGMKAEDEPMFVCRKGFHAINVQGVVDADMLFLNMNCKFPGSTHDAFIYQNSRVPEIVGNMAEKGHLLGDSGYPLRDELLTPFSNPVTPSEVGYNKAHCKTRNVVERSFGVLKSRFRCLHPSGGVLPFKPSKCAQVIETCIRLHNKAVEDRVPLLNGGIIINHHNDYVYHGEPATRTAQEKRQSIANRF